MLTFPDALRYVEINQSHQPAIIYTSQTKFLASLLLTNGKSAMRCSMQNIENYILRHFTHAA